MSVIAKFSISEVGMELTDKSRTPVAVTFNEFFSEDIKIRITFTIACPLKVLRTKFKQDRVPIMYLTMETLEGTVEDGMAFSAKHGAHIDKLQSTIVSSITGFLLSEVFPERPDDVYGKGKYLNAKVEDVGFDIPISNT